MMRPFGKLSGGQKRRCEIARALMHSPRILFLDEPTTGLDPATRNVVWNCIEILCKQHDMTVFLTTHYMEEAARANHIAILDKGKILEYGTPFELKQTYAKDRLLLYPTKSNALKEYLKQHQIEYSTLQDAYVILYDSTLDSLPLITQIQSMIAGYEVIQGSMDDVFLNITRNSSQKEDIQ